MQYYHVYQIVLLQVQAGIYLTFCCCSLMLDDVASQRQPGLIQMTSPIWLYCVTSRWAPVRLSNIICCKRCTHCEIILGQEGLFKGPP